MVPKTSIGWISLIAITLYAGIGAWLKAGGPDVTVLGQHVLASALMYLAYFTTPPAAAAALSRFRGGSRGFTSQESVLIAGAVGVLLLVAGLWLTACSAAQQQAAKTDVANLGECILAQVTSCALATPPTPWQACTAETAVACGTDVATVVSIWASHQKAQLRQSDAGAKALSYPGP